MKTSVSACRMNSIVAIADGGRALRVDIDQHIDAVFQVVHKRFPQRSVEMLVHLCVLQKFAALRPALRKSGSDRK